MLLFIGNQNIVAFWVFPVLFSRKIDYRSQCYLWAGIYLTYLFWLPFCEVIGHSKNLGGFLFANFHKVLQCKAAQSFQTGIAGDFQLDSAGVRLAVGSAGKVWISTNFHKMVYCDMHLHCFFVLLCYCSSFFCAKKMKTQTPMPFLSSSFITFIGLFIWFTLKGNLIRVRNSESTGGKSPEEAKF